MLYRECGVYRTSYAKDTVLFPLRADRLGTAALVLAAVLLPPLLGTYWLRGILIPFLVFSLAALGLNFLTGYAGQLSLGQSAFMAVGAYTGVILYGRYAVPLPLALLGAGLVAAATGAVAGTPSLRIKGFYLAVATLAAQFLITWTIQHVRWISGGVFATINTPAVRVGSLVLDTALRQYYLALATVALLTTFGMNLARSRIGRAWMAIRDRDIAAQIIGIRLLPYKVLAFVVSAFYAGVAGALVVFCWYGSANIEEFDLVGSVRILGMVIIGGMGSVVGSFLGAGFVTLLPILVSVTVHRIGALSGGPALSGLISSVEDVIFGTAIILFLVLEPLGLARLWKTIKDYLRLWPFPY
ncbi:MAG TPA: branched-chain amino acid ABC transporter permease [bacterium]|nr:branched-chain amino acid ABC transporter permease [bacterium]